MKPFMTVEKMGFLRSVSVVDGIQELHLKGLTFVAGVVLVCSVIIPILKNCTLIVLSWSVYTGGRGCGRLQTFLACLSKLAHLDVYAISIFITVIKLRPMMLVEPASPGLPAFTAAVVLSMISSLILPRHSTFVSESSERSLTMERPRFVTAASFVFAGVILGVIGTVGVQLYSPIRSTDISVVFDNVDGIRPGALVKDVAGVEVGTVIGVTSAPDNKAKLFLRFHSDEPLPGESSKFKIDGGIQISLTGGMNGSLGDARFVRFERGTGKGVNQFVGESKPAAKEGLFQAFNRT